jgi:DNA-binding transcriptional regulator GbsR (MarR family)
VVHKIHRQGARKEFYRAEADVWTLFRRILAERKRRELDPTLGLLDRTDREIGDEPELRPLHERVMTLRRFFRLIDSLAGKLAALEADDLESIRAMFLDEDSPGGSLESGAATT